MDTHAVVTARPPAKLNLFLELVARRDDGYHDIDTVMAAIDWRDKLVLRRTREPLIRLQCRWSPSRDHFARTLNLDTDDPQLDLPQDESNLVYRALKRFADQYEVEGGFECLVEKEIPAGAGMGGASSDAAAALLAAAKACQIDRDDASLVSIAGSLGSDVPFFLGPTKQQRQRMQHDLGPGDLIAARAEGTGTAITPFTARYRPFLVCAFPPLRLSTPEVYQASSVPQSPQTAQSLIEAWSQNHPRAMTQAMLNRLSEPATRMVPQIAQILDIMWRAGASACQLTGSGSACFALADDRDTAKAISEQLRVMDGLMVRITEFCDVPTPLVVSS